MNIVNYTTKNENAASEEIIEECRQRFAEGRKQLEPGFEPYFHGAIREGLLNPPGIHALSLFDFKSLTPF